MQNRALVKWVVLAAVCVVGGFSSRASLAGVKSSNGVYFDGFTAYGSVGSARNSSDSNQRIDCSVGTGWVGGTVSADEASCTAIDSTGASLGCRTTNTEFFDVIRSIGSTSHISFTTDASLHCQDITVTNSSRYTVPVH